VIGAGHHGNERSVAVVIFGTEIKRTVVAGGGNDEVTGQPADRPDLLRNATASQVVNGRDGLVDQGLLGEQGLEFRTENVDQSEREVAVAFLERRQCDQLALAR
jgi:hypothetical protein